MSAHLARYGLELGSRCKKARTDAQIAIAALIHEVSEVEHRATTAAEQLEAAVEDGGGRAALRRALDEQSRMLQVFNQELVELVQEQGALVDSLSQGCARIEEVRNDMEELAHEANMLAVNTAVSASQLGSQGATVGSVARHMQDLSADVATTSNELAGRVTDLRRQLPALEASSKQLMAETQALAAEVERIESEFGEHTTRMTRSVDEALRETQGRVGALKADGAAAREHLSMIDGLEQRLSELEMFGVQAVFADGPAGLLAALTGIDADGTVLNEEEEESPEAGDVLLF